MDPKEIDFVTMLLAIGQGWGQSFFVSCLLYLSPEDLKACRLVNTTWNKVVKERMWGNKKARKTLEEKLSQRWNTTNPEAVELTMLESVGVLFCNDKYVFCGTCGGSIKVFSLDGQWVRDLEEGWEFLKMCGNESFVNMCGNESIVAAEVWSGWGCVLKIWSSKEEMGRLHSFELGNVYSLNSSIKVAEQVKKVVILQRGIGCEQLVVLQEGENNWETKTLESFPTPGRWRGTLAVDKDFIAVVGSDQRPNSAKVKLWKEDIFVQDILLQGLSADDDFADVVMQSPILIASGSAGSNESVASWIKVFKLPADKDKDKDMEKLNAVTLIKTVSVAPKLYGGPLFCNRHVFGWEVVSLESGISMNLFEKTALLDPETGDLTERNVIPLPQVDWETANARSHNTTSLVFVRRAQDGENYLYKKDFWMSNTVA